jgi:hypothetical protein
MSKKRPINDILKYFSKKKKTDDEEELLPGEVFNIPTVPPLVTLQLERHGSVHNKSQASTSQVVSMPPPLQNEPRKSDGIMMIGEPHSSDDSFNHQIDSVSPAPSLDTANTLSQQQEEEQTTMSMSLRASPLNDISYYVGVKFKTNEEKMKTYDNIWVPMPHFIGPLSTCGRKLRFQYNWLHTYSWIAYSKIEDGVYCKACVFFCTRWGWCRKSDIRKTC